MILLSKVYVLVGILFLFFRTNDRDFNPKRDFPAAFTASALWPIQVLVEAWRTAQEAFTPRRRS